MKKILFLLLLCSYVYAAHAQETSDSMQTKRTKIKVKSKPNSSDINNNTMDNGTMDNSSEKTKTKIKSKDNDDMQKGTMNATDMNSNMNSSSTLTNTTKITIQGWRTDPPSLPVIGTDVASDVVTNIKSKYGSNIYDIKKVKITSSQDAYAVRVMENGAYNTYYVDASGNVVTR